MFSDERGFLCENKTANTSDGKGESLTGKLFCLETGFDSCCIHINPGPCSQKRSTDGKQNGINEKAKEN